MTEIPAGWYPDPAPQTLQGRLRYWDGRQWTGHVHDPQPAVPATPTYPQPATPPAYPQGYPGAYPQAYGQAYPQTYPQEYAAGGAQQYSQQYSQEHAQPT